ncbi:MAG: TlpA family protein disulfide reductase [Gammaproteobacteria bacterium]|nr:TlpA family protein disulfide reductase [Gammaproteobacteria bacterium]
MRFFLKQIPLLVSLIFITVQAIAGPDYSLKDLSGQIHKVSDVKGKWLIMNFWATWCPPCIHEIPELEKFYQNNQETAEVWGVTFENSGIDTVKSFLKEFNVSYPILGYGQDPKTGYGFVTVLPTTFIIDQQGKFYHRFEGPITEQDILEVITPK